MMCILHIGHTHCGIGYPVVFHDGDDDDDEGDIGDDGEMISAESSVVSEERRA